MYRLHGGGDGHDPHGHERNFRHAHGRECDRDHNKNHRHGGDGGRGCARLLCQAALWLNLSTFS